MNPEEVLALPAYLGYIMMGALSPDHTNLSMPKDDLARYSGIERWKRRREFSLRNLNATANHG